MAEITYVHAADLHLDSPCLGVDNLGPDTLDLLMKNSPLKALENLARLTEFVKADFLLISGDVYNDEMHDLGVRLHFKNFCERLNMNGIKIFLIHGNHDPYDTRLKNLSLPDNVFVFGPDLQETIFEKNGIPSAVIHGFSLLKNFNPDSVPPIFKRNILPQCLHIGMSHCDVKSYKEDGICPLYTVDELISYNMDAFALGHKHTATIINEYPLIAYSGCIQGNQNHVTGSRGCFVVNAHNTNEKWQCDYKFYPLNAIQWEDVTVTENEFKSIDELPNLILEKCLDKKSDISEFVSLLFITLYIYVKNDFYRKLKSRSGKDIFGILDSLKDGWPPLYVINTKIVTTIEEKIYNKSTDINLSNEIAYVADELQNEDNIVQNLINPLFIADSNQEKIVKTYKEDFKNIIQDAECYCQNILEDE